MVVYGIDAGGTNLRIASVEEHTGKIVKRLAGVPSKGFCTNKDLTDFISSNIPDGSSVGCSIAGTVDEASLIVGESPNSPIKGNITFAKDLRDMGYLVTAANDMKAAVQGVARYGEGRSFRNVLVATYSSGYNCAVARDGICVTQAEFGHSPYKQDSDMFCGCGGRGHLEIFVSGNGAASIADQYFRSTKVIDHPIMKASLADYNLKKGTGLSISDLVADDDACVLVRDGITAKHVYQAYAGFPAQEPQKSIRNMQVKAIVFSFGMMNSAYNPLDAMFLMGSQTKDWDLLFDRAKSIYCSSTSQLQIASLDKPRILRLDDPDIGIKGAVADFINKNR